MPTHSFLVIKHFICKGLQPCSLKVRVLLLVIINVFVFLDDSLVNYELLGLLISSGVWSHLQNRIVLLLLLTESRDGAFTELKLLLL